jgi:hypothetical protein
LVFSIENEKTERIVLKVQALVKTHRPTSSVFLRFFLAVPTEKAVLVGTVDVAADDGYASCR